MNIRNNIGRAAGIAVVVICWLSWAAMASASPAVAGPELHGCVFLTSNGHYLTAVGGGGLTTDAIHSDATQIGSWEKFDAVNLFADRFAYRTFNGHYLTAVGNGGRTTDVVRTAATQVGTSETFIAASLGSSVFGIETPDQVHFLTAVGGGGLTTNVIHSDATRIQGWEKFTITCGH